MTLRKYSRFTSSSFLLVDDSGTGELVRGMPGVGVAASDGLLSLVRVVQ